MKKCFSKALSGFLATAMLLTSSIVATPVTAMAADLSTVGGWYETLYAEWSDSNPDSTAVKVGYKLSSDSSYTYLSGDDYTYLIRSGGSGKGRVDIPGLKAGTYDIEVTASNGTVYTKTGVEVYAHDRSGYAHFNNTEGVGAYNDDGTPKANAIVVYVTDSNKNSVTIPGYGNQTINYTKSDGSASWTRDTAGIGDILNNNYSFIKQVTVTDNHPLIIRFIGNVNPPENLTPYAKKDNALGGSTSDNGYLAITKDSRNITLEGIGTDATITGWGFTFSKSSTAGADTDKNFEVRNLTFTKYPEDGLAFQGHDSNPLGIQRCWVHNNNFYPGYCSNPTESDKSEGDGSCDFKRGNYYTNSYNYYEKCHKTNLIGSGTSDDQNFSTFHHNYYNTVGSRQPLAANGVMHIYSSYFKGATSTTVDTRGSNSAFLEENYYDNCKGYIKMRNNTCVTKSYNEIISGGKKDSIAGTYTVASSRTQSAIKDNGYKFPDGGSNKDWDMNSKYFYYKNGKSDVQVLTPAAQVPAYVTEHAGTLKAISDPGTTPGEGGGTVTPPVTEETTTETTTKTPTGGDETTETTTQAPVVSGDGYSHSFDAGEYDKNGFYTISGNLSESKGEITYNGDTITQCLKMESATNVSFNAPKAGKLTLVFGGSTAASGKKVKIDGTDYTADANGIVTADLAAGSHTVTKGDSINLFYMNYAVEGGSSTEESSTETTTQTPVQGAKVAVGSASGNVGTSVTISVKASGMDTLAALGMNIYYDASKLNVTGVTAGNAFTNDASFEYSAANGTITVAATNPRNTMGGDVLFNINATLTAEGTAALTADIKELYAKDLAVVNATAENGTVTITGSGSVTPSIIKGDANDDGVVDKADVTHILNYVTHKIAEVANPEAADVNGDSKVTTKDANKIMKFVLNKISSL